MNQLTTIAREHEAPYRNLVEQHGSPLLVLDCDVLRKQYRDLKAALPRVELFYAIKSLPQRSALAAFAVEGAGFDVATTGELELLRSINANPRLTIHTHPIKRDQDIRDALRFGCTTFVIDNIDELAKFEPYRSRVGLLLRVSIRNRDAVVDLSRKFGCDLENVPYLLAQAAKLGVYVKGLSFHVGSQSLRSNVHVEAINACRQFYENSVLVGAERMSMLDIGGGFPADYGQQNIDLTDFCQPINTALAEYPEHVRLIAEPGRFLCAPAMISISSVAGKAERDGKQWYYLDDGVYGSYSGVVFDHANYPLTVFSDEKASKRSVLAGPTCDSIDVIAEDILLPALNIGDLIVGKQMGAYTLATASEFNSIPKTTVLVLNAIEHESENIRYLFSQR